MEDRNESRLETLLVICSPFTGKLQYASEYSPHLAPKAPMDESCFLFCSSNLCSMLLMTF